MIDTLHRHRSKAQAQESTILQDLQFMAGREVQPYAILTLHRPSNVSGQKLNWSARYGDGNAAKRIIKVLVDDFCDGRSLVDSEGLLQS